MSSQRILLLCISSLALALALGASQAAANTGADPQAGRPDQAVLLVAPEGGGLAELPGGGYLSPVTAAPRPFTHLLVRWEASVPLSATVRLELRASLDGSRWTDWGAAPENPDLWVPADGPELFWSQEIYAGEGARLWQLRARLDPAPDGAIPALRRVEVNTVDARWDVRPTADAPPLPASARPPVVTRTAWGSPDGQGSRVQPVYYPVTHMVVHHTADANSLTGGEQRWSDRVRAIWSFHTFTRGWGDIGYNYLIDPTGVVYEGRAGGDDAVAFHDTANYGSMGTVIIGTYSGVDPPAPAVDSLVDLLAWKAEQKRIDPLGRSFYYGCSISRFCAPFTPGAIVENVAGHRQVTPGRTSCPGDRLLGFLPGVRQRVSERIAGAPINDALLVDELEGGFTRSDATWYSAGCGYGGNAFYTYATDTLAESTNRAAWRPTLAAAGRYRVLAHIPQGCGLSQLATTQARYRIHAADGTYEVRVNQRSSEEWVDLGVYTFSAGEVGYVELDDLTGEPYRDRRVIFFDSLRFVLEEPGAQAIELLQVQYDRTSVAAGELLKVTFTVRNSGSVAAFGQAPEAGTRPDALASFDLANSYAYDEAECFLGAAGQGAPSYPKEVGRFRVMLGAANRDVSCAGGSAGYPWRWGINGRLDPGQTRQVVGYVRFREPGVVNLQAGAIQEYIGYMGQGLFPTTITVTEERLAPAPMSYDATLRPLAHVYRLGDTPDNLLARTGNPLSILKGAYVGAFPWQGELVDWGESGPLAGVSDGFIVEQTRVFIAPEAGDYAFALTNDDGAWLWVNGALVAANPGLGETDSVTGTIALEAGRHVLSVKYFDRSGAAALGYRVRMPGEAGFIQPIDGLGGRGTAVDRRLGATFRRLSGLTIAADDQGGSGVTAIRWSWDGVTWLEEPGSVLTIGGLVDGSYTLRYLAIDSAGNPSAVEELSLRVDSGLVERRVYLPLADR